MATEDSTSSFRLEAAHAQLALQLERTRAPDHPGALGHPENAPAGIEPSDEDLAALCEGRMDDTRRAQIIGHIANNQDIYQRWLRCVEMLAYLGEIGSEQELQRKGIEESHQSTTRGFFAGLSGLFSAGKIGVLGSGFATIAVVVLVILLVPFKTELGTSESIDEIYAKWGPSIVREWSGAPDHPTAYSSSRSFFFKPKSTARQIIETGFKRGASRLGEDSHKAFAIDTKKLSDVRATEVTALTQGQYQALYETGRLAALISLQCELDTANRRLEDTFDKDTFDKDTFDKDTFDNDTFDVVARVVDELRPLAMEETKELVRAFENTADAKTAQCAFGKAVIALLQK